MSSRTDAVDYLRALIMTPREARVEARADSALKQRTAFGWLANQMHEHAALDYLVLRARVQRRLDARAAARRQAGGWQRALAAIAGAWRGPASAFLGLRSETALFSDGP